MENFTKTNLTKYFL